MKFLHNIKSAKAVEDTDKKTSWFDEDSEDLSYRQTANKTAQEKNVVGIHAVANQHICLVRPNLFEDVSGIADKINDNITVVLNLEDTNKDIARRLIDFLSGVVYIRNGQINRIAGDVFLITSSQVNLMGNLSEDSFENTQPLQEENPDSTGAQHETF